MRFTRKPWGKRFALGVATAGALGALTWAAWPHAPVSEAKKLSSAFSPKEVSHTGFQAQLENIYGKAGERFAESIKLSTEGFEHHIQWDDSLVPSGAEVHVALAAPGAPGGSFVPFRPNEPANLVFNDAYLAKMYAHNSERVPGGPHVTVFSTHATSLPFTISLARLEADHSYTLHQVGAGQFNARFVQGKAEASRVYTINADERVVARCQDVDARVKAMLEEVDALAPLLGEQAPAEIHLSFPMASEKTLYEHGRFLFDTKGKALISFRMPVIQAGNERAMAFHEASHNVFRSNGCKADQIAYSDFAERRLTDLLNQLPAGTREAARDAFFKLHKESEYLPPGQKAGHPEDNADELFASTGTVFRHFGPEWVKRVSAADPAVRDIAVENALHVVRVYRAHSDAVFDASLMRYVRENAKRLGFK